jgi:hypothetical protein
VAWPSRWVEWPDFPPASESGGGTSWSCGGEGTVGGRVGRDRLQRGAGRTGTALACLAVLDGVGPGEAVAYVRRHYLPRAVENTVAGPLPRADCVKLHNLTFYVARDEFDGMRAFYAGAQFRAFSCMRTPQLTSST